MSLGVACIVPACLDADPELLEVPGDALAIFVEAEGGPPPEDSVGNAKAYLSARVDLGDLVQVIPFTVLVSEKLEVFWQHGP